MNFESNTFRAFLKEIQIENETYKYFDVARLNEEKYNRLPFSIRVLLESAVRNCDEFKVTSRDIKNILNWPESQHNNVEIQFQPSRVVLQDFSAIPSIIDFAAMRDTIEKLGGDPASVNPICPADLVVDHSIQVDIAKKLIINVPAIVPKETTENKLKRPTPLQTSRTSINNQAAKLPVRPTSSCSKIPQNKDETSLNQILVESVYRNCPFHNIKTECATTLDKNQDLEFERNYERLQFLKWASHALTNTLIVPPSNNSVHQVNLECLARVVFNTHNLLYPDSLVGTDSHTTMINSLGIVGWTVGGMEAEAVMLGQAVSMVLPQVVGYRITGRLPELCTSTDVVLTITKHLRTLGVANKFVEFYGPGVEQLSIADRSTIASMCPEYGATIGYFAADEKAMEYLKRAGRTDRQVCLIREYLEAVGLFRDEKSANEEPSYSEIFGLDLSLIQSCVSGPKRPQDKICLSDVKDEFRRCLTSKVGPKGFGLASECVCKRARLVHKDVEYTLSHGSVLIAEISSCTNTSNPSVMLAAGLLAKKACEMGMKVSSYIKTSLSPGSGVVTDYLTKSGMAACLESLGFSVVGYGCTRCIGNSATLEEEVATLIEENDLVACSVLSGNRNFEGRIHASTRANYLVSPLLVIAYALAGRIDIDLESEPLAYSPTLAKQIYLKDIWPSRKEIQELEATCVIPEIFSKVYRDNLTVGNSQWTNLHIPKTELFQWNPNSSYIRPPPFFDHMPIDPTPIQSIINAHVLLYLGDSITTDHISPAGSIARNSPAAKYLMDQGIVPRDFNSYGSRTGNDQVMLRATFANIRLANRLLGGQIGPKTLYVPENKVMDIHEASELYKKNNIPMVIIAGRDYGSGSSRDWAAKGPCILGVRAILAISYERIHRANLISMGIIPFQFLDGQSAEGLRLTGKEKFTFSIDGEMSVRKTVTVETNTGVRFKALARVDTNVELSYLKHGGVLKFVARSFLKSEKF